MNVSLVNDDDSAEIFRQIFKISSRGNEFPVGLFGEQMKSSFVFSSIGVFNRLENQARNLRSNSRVFSTSLISAETSYIP
jgi:hypothetical protein